MRRGIVVWVLLAVVVVSLPVQADASGQVSVIDGDTIELSGTRIRLHGIDAPEDAQACLAGGELWRCGQEASRALRERIANQTVTCEERDRDRYGRIVAICRLGGTDLNAWMVSEGWALAYRQYSSAYVKEETWVEATGRGIWRGDFIAPWDWRKGKRLRSVHRDTESDIGRNTGECRIKGNISRDGTRIYHVPGGHYYERTKISTSKGERWFCSEAEARQAGWRRSRR